MGEQLELFGEPAGAAAPFASVDIARAAARTCTRCDLAATRRQVVFGLGPAHAALMVVGEGPSEADDASGQPFSGPTGRLLDAWLRAIGLERSQVWLTNVVRCRAAQVEGGRLRNRPPRPAEIAACRYWMDIELRLVRPRAVLCLGATAARALLGRGFQLAAERGRWRALADGTPALVTYNPAYVLRLEGDAHARAEHEVALDLASVRERLLAAG
ncbi:MAG: uracil-DNA glycosylase [Chloroflexi bacterium]|nr:uracil-DNA glycosylase [Chloroflexota bacterium]